MKWDKKTSGLVLFLASFSFIGLILVQILLLGQALRHRVEIFDRHVNSALSSIVQKLETRDMLKRIIRMSVEVDSTGDYNTTTMHIMEQDETSDRKKFVLKNSRQFKSNVQIDSNKIILHLRTTRHIKLIQLDEKKTELKTAFEARLKAGIHEIPIDHLTHESVTHFNLMIDGVAYPFYLDKSSPGRLVIDPELDQTRRALLDKVIEQYMVFEPIPLEERIGITVLDSIVHTTLQESGIKARCVYGIVALQNDSLIYVSQDVDRKPFRGSTHRTLLFPHDAFVESNELILYFPDQKRAVLIPLLAFAGITCILLSAIIASFVIVIRSIRMQKSLAKRLVDFINNMTHEFKTPLSTIAIAGESIKASATALNEQRLVKYGSIIRDESARMQRQVDKILDMADLERGKFELNIEPVDIHRLVDKTVDHFRIAAEKQNVIITTDYSAEINTVNIDSIHMMNCLFNLLDNAIKYSKGHRKIHVYTRKNDHYMQLSVQDNGIGLRPEEQKRVFEKYYRVPTGNVHNVKGLGLGLSYVKFIVEAHGGYVKVDSELDKYSIFSIFLPIQTNGVEN